VTREELSELDKRIAASVARGEAAIARQEAAVARQDEFRGKYEAAVVRQQEATARIEAATARMAGGEGGLVAEVRALRAEIVSELREARDERRAMIEALLRLADRLPPPAAAT
jgi:septal ring factor EnvC (AmiA/AmiB activator)